MHKVGIIRAAFVLLLLPGIAIPAEIGNGPQRYTDVYNFFSLTPPPGWRAKVLDSPSSKVKFYPVGTDVARKASIFVVVNPAGLQRSLKEVSDARLRQLRKLGGSNIVNRAITFEQSPCRLLSATLNGRGIALKSYIFSKYNRAYTIMCTVPLSRLDEFQPLVNRAIQSFTCILPDDYIQQVDASPPKVASRSELSVFDVKESFGLLAEKDYPGAIGGKLNFAELTVQNTGSRPIEIGGEFRLLMDAGADCWHQFALGTINTNEFDVSENSILRYGMGASTMAAKTSGRQAITLIFHGMRRVVTDTTAEKKGIDLSQWWPQQVAPGETVKLKWPTFWFSDMDADPLAVDGPKLRCAARSYYTWLDLSSGKLRIIPAEDDALLKLVRDEREQIGLRCAAMAWLALSGRENVKYLLPYIKTGTKSRSLEFRAMQAIVVWGRADVLDKAYDLWRNHQLAESLDYDICRYLSWSALDHASELITKIKLGGRR